MEEKKSDLDPGPVLPVAQSKKETETRLVSDFVLDDLIKTAANKGAEAPSRSSGVPSPEVVRKVCTEILVSQKLAINEINLGKAELAIALLAQLGATSPKFSDTRSEEYFLEGVTVKHVRTAAANNKTTIRALGRALRDVAMKVAYGLDIAGNLSKSYQLDHPQAQREELYWTSDFQAFSDDPVMPESVRNWLLENYNRRFRKS